MSERPALIATLSSIAQRLRLKRGLNDWAGALCLLLAGALVYQILAAFRPSARAIIGGALLVWALGVVVWLARRLRAQLGLEQAALAADENADLKDELKSAYWFSGRPERTPLIDVLLQRADRTAQRLNALHVVPGMLPQRAALAAILAVVSGALAWWSPQLSQSFARMAANANSAAQSSAGQSPEAAARPAQAAQRKAREEAAKLAQEAVDRAAQEKARAEILARERAAALAAAAAKSEAEALAKGSDDAAQWAKLEAALKDLPGGDTALAAAIKARDAKRAAQLLEELERKHQLAQADLSLQPKTDLPFGDRGEGFVPKLQDLFQQQDDPFADPKNLETADDEALRKATNAAQRMDENTQANERNRNLKHEEAYSASITRDSVIEASRFGERDPAEKDMQPSEETGATVMKGGVMHRRAAMTRGDPDQDGGSRVGEAEGESKADPMIGKQTERLEAQLKRVDIEAKKDKNDAAEGDPDKFFAATRQQEAKLAYSDIARRARYVSEAATSGERVPLAYRETVKDYFINLRQKEK